MPSPKVSKPSAPPSLVRFNMSTNRISFTQTTVLVGLYEEPERPPNAVEYIKRYLGAPAGVDVEALKSENARLKKENAALQEKIEQAANNPGKED